MYIMQSTFVQSISIRNAPRIATAAIPIRTETIRAKPTLWKHIEPIEQANGNIEQEHSYQIMHAAAGFDPTQSSPPNPFMEQLKQRMSTYFSFSVHPVPASTTP